MKRKQSGNRVETERKHMETKKNVTTIYFIVKCFHLFPFPLLNCFQRKRSNNRDFALMFPVFPVSLKFSLWKIHILALRFEVLNYD